MGDEFEYRMTTKKTNKKRNGKENKRRFSCEQVEWLERMFKNETKLEPRKKAEVAGQLGLQPRQVAIWFQNKRARWKSRQLQRDFDALRLDYDALSSRFHLLQRHNLSLSLQLQKLKELTGSKEEESYKGDDKQVSESKKGDKKDEKKACLSENDDSKQLFPFGIGGDQERRGDEVLTTMTCSSLTSSEEEWNGLHPDALFDQSPHSCNWWDFWP